MKRLLVIADGFADEPCASLGGLTPLQYLRQPDIDAFAASGRAGSVQTVPDGCPAASETAIPAILGYDPTEEGWGRGFLEAAGVGIELKPGHLALRINIRAGSRWNAPRISALAGWPDARVCSLQPGRFLLILPGASPLIDCPAPFSERFSANSEIVPLAPEAIPTALALNDLVSRSGGKVIPWGPSVARSLVPFSRLHPWAGRGAVVAAVPLLMGFAKLAEMKFIDVPGATGDCHTDYTAKTAAAIEALRLFDFVLLHIEAPDAASHLRDVAAKLDAVRAIGSRVVRSIAQSRAGHDVRVAFMPDHITSVSSGCHLPGPVPYILWGAGIEAEGRPAFDESVCQHCPPLPVAGFLDRIFS